MGVLTRPRPMDDIVAELDRSEPVAVISCNNCVRISGAGGEGVFEPFCKELRARGFRVEQEILVTNPCSRGYLEDLRLAPAVKTVLLMACRGAQSGFISLHPDMHMVPTTDSLGLYVVSMADGVVKLMAPFPEFAHLKNVEYAPGKVGDGPLPGIKLSTEQGGVA